MEKLNLPLYHGTSTLFLEDIRKEGLGKINILEKYKIIPTLSGIYKFGAQQNIENWEIECDTIRRMINQTPGGANFQHGQVYLSTSFYTANRYASSNKYGSEIVSETIELYEKLIKNNLSYNLDNEFLESVIGNEYQPIVFKTKKLYLNQLKSESGRGIEALVKWIEKHEGSSKKMGKNFRLVGVIPFDELEIVDKF